jgi:glycosyltransferase involved in cell wall biosynthesis
LPWGPDLDFYTVTEPGQGIVAAGRTHRDFATLATAATDVDYPVSVLTTPDCWTFVPEKVRHGVDAIICEDPSAFSWSALVQRYAKAAAIAVPMYPREELCGLTSVVDALGMGRAVVVTRNRCIDIDVEREGVGMWVSPGDVDGWAKVIRYVRDNPDEIRRMGARARRLAETKYSSRIFGERLVDVFRHLRPECR